MAAAVNPRIITSPGIESCRPGRAGS
jgi:hypothetical protein